MHVTVEQWSCHWLDQRSLLIHCSSHNTKESVDIQLMSSLHCSCISCHCHCFVKSIVMSINHQLCCFHSRPHYCQVITVSNHRSFHYHSLFMNIIVTTAVDVKLSSSSTSSLVAYQAEGIYAILTFSQSSISHSGIYFSQKRLSRLLCTIKTLMHTLHHYLYNYHFTSCHTYQK